MTTFSDHLTRWRRHRAAWMDQPEGWVWAGQGPGLHFCAGQVGVANLLWLSLDMATPPASYNARDNKLYVLMLLYSTNMLIDGVPLVEHADCLTLEQFRDLCATGKWSGPVHSILPLIHLLANKRLNHAHT